MYMYFEKFLYLCFIFEKYLLFDSIYVEYMYMYFEKYLYIDSICICILKSILFQVYIC